MIFFFINTLSHQLQLFILVVKILSEMHSEQSLRGRPKQVPTELERFDRFKIGLLNFIVPVRRVNFTVDTKKYTLHRLFCFLMSNQSVECYLPELDSSMTPKYLTSPRLRRFESSGDKPCASNHEDVLKRHSAQ